MNRKEFIEKLEMVFLGDRNAFNDIVNAYNDLLIRNDKATDFIFKNTSFEHDGDEYIYMEWVDIINMTTQTFIEELLDILYGKSDE